MYRIYYRYYCYPHFHGIYMYYVTWLVLTSVCCDSNILLFTQKISVLAFPSAEIRMCVGTHEYDVPGMVCGPCVLMMHTQQLVDFLLFSWTTFGWFVISWGEE